MRRDERRHECRQHGNREGDSAPSHRPRLRHHASRTRTIAARNVRDDIPGGDEHARQSTAGNQYTSRLTAIEHQSTQAWPRGMVQRQNWNSVAMMML
jgi:hypothetical protein